MHGTTRTEGGYTIRNNHPQNSVNQFPANKRERRSDVGRLTHEIEILVCSAFFFSLRDMMLAGNTVYVLHAFVL